MRHPTKIAALLLFAAVARADDPKPRHTNEEMVVNLGDVHWVKPTAEGIPVGVEASPIATDKEGGGSIGYGKIPAGTHFPSHWHSHAEHTVVIHGKAKFTLAGKEHEIG